MPDNWLTDAAQNAVGAAVGSGIATWHHFRRDGIMKSAVRFFSGFWFGIVALDKVLMWLDWESTSSNKLFAGSLIGLGAFIVVQIVLSEKTKEMAQDWLAKRAEK